MLASKPVYSPDTAFDADGFLCNPQLWDEALAIAIARRDSLELTPAHWQVIRALREHFHKFGAVPPAFSHLCIVNHLDKHCVGDLFRSQREAWRVAGLPGPGEEAKSYM